MVRVMIKGRDAFVWNAEDWMKLRQKHRIIGNLVGCLAQVPRQDVENGLPMKLLPEEVTLIKEMNIGELFAYVNPKAPPTEETKKKFNEYNERIKKEQVDYYEQKRKQDVLSMIDIIVEGKRRKLLKGDQEVVIEKDEILKSELEKTNTSNLQAGVNVQIPTEHPWFKLEDFIPAEWTYPESPLEKLKYKVFKDLWGKGYYITMGTKFGGDFLIYPGEPLKFHAFFIILCALENQNLPLTKLVTHTRLATMTKKTFVIASEQEGRIFYSSFQWTGII
ncbi:tRNA-splicing endonuclease subunit Sen34 [Cimex lectularius]|uniref:tRNA-splicing endonuclease subunit Sen34 n=1 Tax=Cimex lectularius TaxID=79782 RepID=A0A8I6SRQ8_CIMLE|nr:tRNA-splicing endonuclease subunit Sen34 [Cimex lectularius]